MDQADSVPVCVSDSCVTPSLLKKKKGKSKDKIVEKNECSSFDVTENNMWPGILNQPLCHVPCNYTKPVFSDSYDPWGFHKGRWTPCFEEYANYNKRFNTFNTWPKQMNPRPIELTQAGFFYSGINDTVYCFFCGKGLTQWELLENAFEAHKKWSPECDYMRMICSA